jgi:predicted anti-sigma-YlaC factor YlaD
MKIKNIQCKEALKHICDKLDVGLNSPRCKTIKKHIRECPDCIAYLDSIKRTIRLYRAYPIPTIPKRVQKKLFDSLKTHSQGTKYESIDALHASNHKN